MAKAKPKTVPVAGAKDSKTTRDSFNNFVAALGLQSNNISAASTYAFSFLTKNRLVLEAMYRDSWICGMAVDIVADDMTQSGIEFNSTMKPEQEAALQEAMEDLAIWPSLTSTIKWSRLYGSCCGFIMIDGQDHSKPLRIETVGKGQFKGILPMDRWQLIPSISNLINDLGPNMGLPKYYRTVPDALIPNFGNIHYTRMIRLDGIELPHYQKTVDNLWGESVLERIYDRLVAFDSSTTGAAQLIYRAYLRTIKVKDLREIIAAGGPAYEGLVKNIEMIRQLQANEGITLLDGEDEFQTSTYTFSGLDNIIHQFAEQLAGALEMPLVRLLGTSPGGMNATGESDLRTYYDGIKKKQNTRLRGPIKKVLQLISMSEFGKPLPDGFGFDFINLWQMTDLEKSDIASKDTTSITTAFEAGIISKGAAIKELRQMGRTTGMFTNISDEEVTDAENEPPAAALALESGGVEAEGDAQGGE